MNNKEIKVLDHGLLRLIDSMGSDLSISRNARVSYAAEPRKQDTKLINYLIKNNHWSPLESCSITFEVKAPIFVFRQWHRHRSQTFNEISARYKELPEEFYIPELDQITTQSTDNKQMRTSEQNPNAEFIKLLIEVENKSSFKKYHILLDKGCPREIARSVLPVGTYSHMFATSNLRSWFHFLQQRLHEHAQYEIRIYAEAILEILLELFPIATEAFIETLRK